MAKCFLCLLSILILFIYYEKVSSIKTLNSDNVAKRLKRQAGSITAKDIKAGDINAASVTADKIQADRIRATNIKAKFLSVRRKKPSPSKPPAEDKPKGTTTKAPETSTKKDIKQTTATRKPSTKTPTTTERPSATRKPSTKTPTTTERSSKTTTKTKPSPPKNNNKPWLVPTEPPRKTRKDGLLKAKTIESKHIDTNYMKADEIKANSIKASVVNTDVINISKNDKKSSDDKSKVSKPQTSESIRTKARKENNVLSKKKRKNRKHKSKRRKNVGKDKTTRSDGKAVSRKFNVGVNENRRDLPMPPPNRVKTDFPTNPMVTINKKDMKRIYLPDLLDDKEDNGHHGIIPNLQFLGLSQDYIKGLQQEQQLTGVVERHPSTKRSRPGSDPNKFVNAHSPELNPLDNF